MAANSMIFHLDCHHTRILETNTSLYAEVYCISCAKMRVVVECIGEYRIRCQDCIYSRRFGGSGMLAFSSARRHAGSKVGHVVLVYRGSRVEHRIISPSVVSLSPSKIGAQLSLDDVPPF